MFHKSPDERLSDWSNFRKELDNLNDPLTALAEFWNDAPLVIHNHKIDPYKPKSWPTPWDLIVENKYDDFTVALMIAYTLRLTKKYKNDTIEVRTMVDSKKTKLYNLVYVNNVDVLNYERAAVVKVQQIDENLYLENLINIIFPR
jgi:hypothetical protein